MLRRQCGQLFLQGRTRLAGLRKTAADHHQLVHLQGGALSDYGRDGRRLHCDNHQIRPFIELGQAAAGGKALYLLPLWVNGVNSTGIAVIF